MSMPLATIRNVEMHSFQKPKLLREIYIVYCFLSLDAMVKRDGKKLGMRERKREREMRNHLQFELSNQLHWASIIKDILQKPYAIAFVSVIGP